VTTLDSTVELDQVGKEFAEHEKLTMFSFHYQFIMFVALMGFICSASQVPEKPQNCSTMPTLEWNALYDIYTTLHGANWIWGALNSLNLNTNLISGTVPSFLYRMTSLEHLQLNSNKLVG
jgi:hypothetical protein